MSRRACISSPGTAKSTGGTRTRKSGSSQHSIPSVTAGFFYINSVSCLQGLQESGVRPLAPAVHWDYMPSGSRVLGAKSTQGQRPLNNTHQKSKTALYLFVETILFKFCGTGQQTTVRSIPCNDKLDLRSRTVQGQCKTPFTQRFSQ